MRIRVTRYDVNTFNNFYSKVRFFLSFSFFFVLSLFFFLFVCFFLLSRRKKCSRKSRTASRELSLYRTPFVCFFIVGPELVLLTRLVTLCLSLFRFFFFSKARVDYEDDYQSVTQCRESDSPHHSYLFRRVPAPPIPFPRYISTLRSVLSFLVNNTHKQQLLLGYFKSTR